MEDRKKVVNDASALQQNLVNVQPKTSAASSGTATPPKTGTKIPRSETRSLIITHQGKRSCSERRKSLDFGHVKRKLSPVRLKMHIHLERERIEG